MKSLFLAFAIVLMAGCNSGDKKVSDVTSSDTTKKDVDVVALSDKHQEAEKDVIGTWRIYKDVSRDGDKCDSASINDGSCTDKNTEMITLIKFETNGNYSLKSGFKNNHPSEDNGTWKITGTKYGIDLLLLESHTTKNGVGPSAGNNVTTYIIQNISFQHLALIDGDLFNTMSFVPDPRPIKQ